MSDQDNTWSESPESPELETPPPAWPKVVGIISIVWASIGLLCGVLGVVSAVFLLPMGRQAIMDQTGASTIPPNMDPGALDYGLFAFGLVLSVMLLVAGVMTVSRNAAGRGLHIVYAFLSIVAGVLNVINQLTTFQELKDWVEREVSDPQIAQRMTNPINLWLGLGVGIVLGLAYPLFCIIWFGAGGKKPEIGKPEIL